jgi:nucleotide-binding universal stress UspA family protein
MGYKTLIAVLQSREDADRVLDCAVPLAAHFGSHLVGIHAEAVPIIYTTPMEFPVSELMEASAEINQKHAREVRGVFESRMSAEGLSSEWHSVENLSGDSALPGAWAARCADLVIAQQGNPEAESAGSGDLNALIFESGRPVLFVPYATTCPSRIRRVLVAWNGKREAARAAFDALPFIMEADETEIFTIDPPQNSATGGEASGVRIAAALARHGASVSVKTQNSDGVAKAVVIENRVSAFGADLLVLGAYSHSRLRELLFGGVTRTILRSMPALTLMSR